MHGHGRNHTHGNAHGNHHRPRREHAQAQGRPSHNDGPVHRPTDSRPPRRRGTTGSSRAMDEGAYPFCGNHMREHFGANWASQPPAFYAAVVGAMDSGPDIRRSPEPHDYELDDLRERYGRDGRERFDPELDRNSNGSPPPPYEP